MGRLKGAFIETSMGVAAVIGMAMLDGCESQRQSKLDLPPDGQRLVGGGMKIVWRAPEEGTAYLVEKRIGRLIETQSLEKGGVYRFAVQTVVEAADMEDLLGINIDDAEFLLYFEPGGPRRSTS